MEMDSSFSPDDGWNAAGPVPQETHLHDDANKDQISHESVAALKEPRLRIFFLRRNASKSSLSLHNNTTTNTSHKKPFFRSKSLRLTPGAHFCSPHENETSLAVPKGSSNASKGSSKGPRRGSSSKVSKGLSKGPAGTAVFQRNIPQEERHTGGMRHNQTRWLKESLKTNNQSKPGVCFCSRHDEVAAKIVASNEDHTDSTTNTTPTLPTDTHQGLLLLHHQHLSAMRPNPNGGGPRQNTHLYPFIDKKGGSETHPQECQIEIGPGVTARLRGAAETWNCVELDFYTTVTCLCCKCGLFCIMDASYVLCPQCRVISPTHRCPQGHSKDNDGGVGIGFSLVDLQKMQLEIIERRRSLN